MKNHFNITQDLLKRHLDLMEKHLNDPDTFWKFMLSEDQWLYPEEAGKVLKVSERSIRYCRQQEYIHAMKVQGQYRYHRLLLCFDLLQMYYEQNYG